MMKVPKRRSCKVCGASFKPERITDWGCCPDHQADYAVSLIKKVRESQRKSAVKQAQKKRVEEKKEFKVRRFMVSKPATQEAEAQKAFNKYIRVRDYGEPCISCGVTMDWDRISMLTGSDVNAGHFKSVGAHSELRFNTFNCNAQCVTCNKYKSGNVSSYRVGLVVKFGSDIVERLERYSPPKRFDAGYLARVKDVFTRRARQLQRRRDKGILPA